MAIHTHTTPSGVNEPGLPALRLLRTHGAPCRVLTEDDDPLEKVGDDELTLGWAANLSQLGLGISTDDFEATVLERHGLSFIPSGPDDAEDSDDDDDRTDPWCGGPAHPESREAAHG